MNDEKEALLNKLKTMGVHSSGRKIRSDKNRPHSMTKQRSDAGVVREHYKITEKVRQRQFRQALEGTAIRNEWEVRPAMRMEYLIYLLIRSGELCVERTARHTKRGREFINH